MAVGQRYSSGSEINENKPTEAMPWEKHQDTATVEDTHTWRRKRMRNTHTRWRQEERKKDRGGGGKEHKGGGSKRSQHRSQWLMVQRER